MRTNGRAFGTALRAVGVIALLAASYTYGLVSFRMELFPYPQVKSVLVDVYAGAVTRFGIDSVLSEVEGVPRTFMNARPTPPDSETEMLLAIGYLQGTNEAGTDSGITRHDTGRASPGWNLATDGAEPAASLFDMDGRVVHRWALSFAEAFPDAVESRTALGSRYWRKVRLLDDGSLLAIYEGLGLVKIDRDSRIVWGYPEHVHHDLDIDANGNIYTLIRDLVTEPRLSEKQAVVNDQIVVLSPDGEELRRTSVLDALLGSDYAQFLDDVSMPQSGDILHTNTLELLDDRLTQRLPTFRPGSALVSWPRLDAIGVVDLEAERVTWALGGMFDFQHDPTVLDNGHLLVLDNLGDQGQSKVIEIDPLTQQVLWAYRGTEHAFITPTCGTNQRLPNGNTLIVETDYGRAFEVTSDQEIVWEYLTPNRAGDHDELIASLFDVVRLPLDLDLSWLGGPTEATERP